MQCDIFPQDRGGQGVQAATECRENNIRQDQLRNNHSSISNKVQLKVGVQFYVIAI